MVTDITRRAAAYHIEQAACDGGTAGKDKGDMDQKEHLREVIEEERKRLNELLKEGQMGDGAYLQSLVLDRLLEQYMEL